MMSPKKINYKNKDKISKILLNSYPNKYKTLKHKSDSSKEKEDISIPWSQAIKKISLENIILIFITVYLNSN